MTQTAKTTLAVTIAVVLVALAVTVKMIFFPSAKDAWFQTSGQRLRQVPAGLAIVRPTHFPKSPTNGMAFTNVKGQRWMSGRNVTLQQLMAIAYSHDPGRVYVPPTAPKNNYDFVVTARSGTEEQLRRAVRKKTGYIADVETRDTDVLALKVIDSTLPGLKASSADEKHSENFKGGKLYITHEKISNIAGPLGEIVKIPVVDKTGLTDFYDFSVTMDPAKGPDQFSRAGIEKILADWGLGLEPDTASIEMLVVKKAD